MYILAGDIGGTKSHLGIFHQHHHKLQLIYEQKFASQKFSAFAPLLMNFFHKSAISLTQIKMACFGVAGPVHEGYCKITNLPWVIQQSELQHLLNCNQVFLINDLEAIAYGVLYANTEHIKINPLAKTEIQSNIAILALGTGFGLAILAWDKSSNRFLVLATESGHSNFAPRTELQLSLLQYLLEHHQKTVYDNLLSGSGLKTIYQFFCKKHPEIVPEWLNNIFQQEDFTKTLITCALKKQELICEKTLDLFTSICAAKIADIALEHLTLGGIYIGGGIAPAILPKLQNKTFLDNFLDKPEKFSELLTPIPIKVLLNQDIGMLGAAYYLQNLN